VTISPIRDWVGQVTGASKIARDISDRKRVERLLIQSEKLVATGRMAATIAHEINNPLESVMNLIYLARQYSSESAWLDKRSGQGLLHLAHVAGEPMSSTSTSMTEAVRCGCVPILHARGIVLAGSHQLVHAGEIVHDSKVSIDNRHFPFFIL
jgi:signal transduction histidine kinase